MLTRFNKADDFTRAQSLNKQSFRYLIALVIIAFAFNVKAQDFIGNHGVVIGGYSTPEQVEQSWNILRLAYPRLIHPVGAAIVEVPRQGGELIYRLVLDGLDASKARDLCIQLSRNGHNCRAIRLPNSPTP